MLIPTLRSSYFYNDNFKAIKKKTKTNIEQYITVFNMLLVWRDCSIKCGSNKCISVYSPIHWNVDLKIYLFFNRCKCVETPGDNTA